MRTILSIPGICCDSCKRLIAGISSLFPQIRTVEVDILSHRVSLQHTEEFNVRSWIALLEHRSHKFKVFAIS